jgi:hypothetical protein
VSTPSRTGEDEPRIVLPGGVTGFRGRRSEPLPETDRQAFAAICNEVARAARGSHSHVGRDNPKLHSALITDRQEKVTLLVHRHAPFLATAANAPQAGPITFIDDPRIHAALFLIARRKPYGSGLESHIGPYDSVKSWATSRVSGSLLASPRAASRPSSSQASI